MFKHIRIYQLPTTWTPTVSDVESALDAQRFVECGASQERSVGWVEPRGEMHGPLVESVAEQWILKFMSESKVVPGSVVKDETNKRVLQLATDQGRKPGKRERKEISEDVRTSLIPMAFSKKSSSFVWIDRAAHMLVVEASTATKADDILTMLVKSLAGFAAVLVATEQAPSVSMAGWLDTQDAPPDFTIDRDCTLRANDESKASVRYAKHALDIDEIRAHITAGKSPVQLGMTWNDRVSFILTDDGAIRKLQFLEGVFEKGTAQTHESSFDGDVAISTGELRKLIPAIIAALGGAMPLPHGLPA